ncbi:hypothetical protein DL764_006581 [Monosporascus ibericus]|uniref:SH3 domain-containing protein n=1 Tax=Monosporascus ibericus TaxID=155417 RepID=A0A4Q4T6E1_9PEZI|nr:hypothetical protein DL764_006581 [Monosporascus ibericus]
MRTALLSILSTAPVTIAQSDCISLSSSTTCPAFSSASISPSGRASAFYPFLQFVSDTASFDEQLEQYVRTSYVQLKYQTLLGCGNVDLVNTTEHYARFTTSVICNAIVQNSDRECGLTGDAARPLCADSCAQFAQSEAYIAADNQLCANPNEDAVASQIRADFQDCVVPANSLSSVECIEAIDNEPTNCGYGSSLIGLCSYCASGGINSTDTCCYNSDAETRCVDVVLPTVVPSVTFSTPAPTSTSTSTPTPQDTSIPTQQDPNDGLSGGAIAGVVIGTLAGLALLIFLLYLCVRIARRRRGSGSSQKDIVFNQPSSSRKGPQVTKIPGGTPSQTYDMHPGGRIARMSALEGHSADASSKHGEPGHGGSAGTEAGAYATSRRRGDTRDTSSDDNGESPHLDTRAGVLRAPRTTRRNGSLSSGSILAGEDPQSPSSGGGMSSPPGVASQQSEQLPFFKDYYSQDDIHPGERVAVLWAYQPRAADEFALERGDMLKVVGIWDDGWATGIMMDERADEWEARRQAQRDSGVSNTSGRGRDTSPPASGEIKAFPLVCVCLPEHWRKTIEGEGSTETGSSAHHGP